MANYTTVVTTTDTNPATSSWSKAKRDKFVTALSDRPTLQMFNRRTT